MKPYTHHIGQLFVLGDIWGFHPDTPLLADCNGEMVLDYLTDWLVHRYTDGNINARDLRHYLNIIEGAAPEMRQSLYSWIQADPSDPLRLHC